MNSKATETLPVKSTLKSVKGGKWDRFLTTLEEEGINFRGLRLVMHLHEIDSGSTKMSTLAPVIGLSSAGITAVADKLEDRGFAKREIRRHDRRSIFLSLTPEGKRFAGWVTDTLHAIPREG